MSAGTSSGQLQDGVQASAENSQGIVESKKRAHLLTADWFCTIYKLAVKHKEPYLVDFATTFFLKKSEEILKVPNWAKFVQECPLLADGLLAKKKEHDMKENIASSN